MMTVKTSLSEIKKTPGLRFPGFSDEWEEKRLGMVLKIGSGRDYKHLETGNVPVFGTGGYMLSVNKSLYSGETVCIGRKGTINKPFYHSGDIWTVDTLFYTYDFKEVTPKFTYSIFQQIPWLKWNEASGVPSLSKATIEKIKIYAPLYDEQQKIADFLESVDMWIKNLQTQKEYLESYKRVMMKKIFYQEIRFKDDDANEFPEWEEKRLGQISEIIMGQSPDSSSYNTNGFGKYLIQGNADITDRKAKPRNWTTKITKECNVGDIIMTVRAPVGYIARSFHNACIGRGVCAIRNNSLSSIGFLYQFLLNFEMKWMKFEQGSTFTAVNTQDVKKLKLLVPSLPEQQKIADFLVSIDNLIDSKQQQITLCTQWKNGLMQGLFV